MKQSLIFLFLLSFFSCKNDLDNSSSSNNIQPKTLTVEDAKNYYLSLGKNGRQQSVPKFLTKKVFWDYAFVAHDKNGVPFVHVDFETEVNPSPVLNNGKSKSKKLEKKHVDTNYMLLTFMIFKRDETGNLRAEMVTYIPDENYYLNKNRSFEKFDGLLTVTDINDNFIYGEVLKNGKNDGYLSLSNDTKTKNKQIKSSTAVDWYTLDQYLNTVYPPIGYTSNGKISAVQSSNPVSTEFYDISHQPNMPADSYPFDYFSATSGNGGTGGASSPNYAPLQFQNINYPGQDNSDVNINTELQCFSGYNSPNDFYEITVYVDQPITNSSTLVSSSFEPGHVFIGFTKIQDGDNKITRNIGFYPTESQSKLSVVSYVPSTIKTDNNHEYEVAIKYKVNATQFTTAVNKAKSSAGNQYKLFSFNCADYVKGICASSGLNIPEGKSKISWQITTNQYTNTVQKVTAEFTSPAAMGQALRSMQNTTQYSIYKLNTTQNAINSSTCN